MKKRGQVTVFIIIAVVILAAEFDIVSSWQTICDPKGKNCVVQN